MKKNRVENKILVLWSSTNPDFSKYSISELQDVILRIDSEAFPERKRQAEKMLQSKLQDDDAVVEEELSRRELTIYFGIFFSLLGLAFLYNPIFEQSVYVRGSGIVNYSDAPSIFWYCTSLYFFYVIVIVSWTLGLIKRT